MKHLYKITLCIFLLTSCKKNKTEFEEQILPPEPEIELGSFNLIFPDNNLICTEGTDVDNNEVSINFMWTAADKASSYTIEITNLATDVTTNTTSTNTSKEITLPKDTQFSWKVLAFVDNISKESSQWSFYSEGITEENFAPFPAEITTEDKLNGFVEISWTGTDLDNDIDTYELYFGADANALEFIVSTTSNEGVSSQPITYGTDYFIEVITTDDRGNTSSSKTSINY